MGRTRSCSERMVEYLSLLLAPRTSTRTNNDLPAVSGLKEHDSLPQFPETPFTKVKRKRVLGDTTHHDDNVDSCSWSLGGNGGPTMTLEDPFAHLRQPSEHARKVARTLAISTPGALHRETEEPNSVITDSQLPRPHVCRQNDGFSAASSPLTHYARSVQR